MLTVAERRNDDIQNDENYVTSRQPMDSPGTVDNRENNQPNEVNKVYGKKPLEDHQMVTENRDKNDVTASNDDNDSSAENSISNTDCVGDYNEGYEQEGDGLLSQEPGRPRASQKSTTTQTSNDGITGTEQGQASIEEELEAAQRDNNQGNHLSEESGS